MASPFAAPSLLALGLLAVEPSLRLHPGSVVRREGRAAPGESIRVEAVLENAGKTPLKLGWTRLGLALPAGWDAAFCDGGACHLEVPEGGAPQSLPPGARRTFWFRVSPDGRPGRAELRLRLEPEGQQPRELRLEAVAR